jgi:hypothetical protein
MNIFNYYKLEFDFSLLNIVDSIITNDVIIRKRFAGDVTYFIKLNQNNYFKILNDLYNKTYHLVKITEIKDTSTDLAEVGTDKPIGSKTAIDEN